MSTNLWAKLFLGSTVLVFTSGCGLLKLFGDNEEFNNGFKKACEKDPTYVEYCQCALEEVKKNTTAFQRVTGSKEAVAAGEAAGKVCLTKATPASARKEFIDQCVGASQAPKFCECSFEYVKTNGLLAEGESAIMAQQGAIKAACSAPLFDDSRSIFLASCVPNAGPGGNTVCPCIFGKLEEKFGRDGLLKEFEANGESLRAASAQAAGTCAQ